MTVFVSTGPVGAVRPTGRTIVRRSLVFLAAVAALAGAMWVGSTISTEQEAPSRADVGFARDMAVHHAQAVQMAELVRTRTTDPAIVTLATDIALTQQAQIGQMQGWLDVWGRPRTSTSPPMAWMDHLAADGMPGMATEAELGQLRESSGADAEELFLRLMIRHHQGGIQMASAAVERAGTKEVETLARGIVLSQVAEVRAMNDMLADRGLEPEPLADGDGSSARGPS